MLLRPHLFGYSRLRMFRNAAVRTGLYVGVALSLIFTAWIFVANRVPGLEDFALERNLAAASALGLLALIPVLRFFRLPGNLLGSSLIAWTLLCFTYRILSIHFSALEDRYSAFQVFIVGAVLYMIIATIAWIGTCIWKARHPRVSHSNHHLG